MATASDIRAGGAFVELYLKGGHLVEQGLDRIANKTKSFAMTLSTVASISNITYGHSATAIRTSLTTIANTVDKVSKGIQTTVRATAQAVTASLDFIPKAINKTGKALESLGTKSLFAGMLGGGLGFQTMGTFMEYERQMARVKALTGATGVMFEGMTEIVLKLGETTQYTSSQVAEGMAYLAMAGLNARDSIAVLPKVLDLATAAQMDLGQTVDIVTDIGLAYGYTGKQVEKVTDVLAQAATNSNTTVEKMGTSFKYLSAVSVQMGQNIEDMATALALLAQVGIKANTAGTNLREAMIAFVTPPKRRKIKMDLGVDVADARGQIRPFFDIIDDLDRALSRFTQDKQAELMTQIFGKRGGNAMMSLTNMSREHRRAMQETIYDYEGATQTMAGIMRDNLWGSWKEFVSVIQRVQIQIGQALVPAIRGLLDYFTQAIRKVRVFIAEKEDLIIKVALAVSALLAAGGAALVLGKALTTVATIITPVTTLLAAGITAVSKAFVGAVGLTTVFTTALMVLASGVQTTAAIMQSLAGVMSIAAIATAGMVGGLVLLGKFIPMLVSGFMSLAGLVPAFASVLTVLGSITAVAGPIILIMEGIALLTAAFWGIIEAVQALAIAFLGMATNIASALGTALLGSLNAIGKALGRLGAATVAFYRKHEAALKGLGTSLKTVYGQMKETFGYVVMALQSGQVQDAMELIKWEAFRQLVNLEQFARALLGGLLVEIPRIMATLGEILTEMFKGMGDSFMELWRTLKEEFNILMAHIDSAFHTFVQRIANSGLLGAAAQIALGVDADANARQARRALAETREQVVRDRLGRFAPKSLPAFNEAATSMGARREANELYAQLTTHALNRFVNISPRKIEQWANDKNTIPLLPTDPKQLREDIHQMAMRYIEQENLARRHFTTRGQAATVEALLYQEKMQEGVKGMAFDWAFLEPFADKLKELRDKAQKMADADRAEFVEKFIAPQVWDRKTKDARLEVLKELGIASKMLKDGKDVERMWKDFDKDEQTKITNKILGENWNQQREKLDTIIDILSNNIAIGNQAYQAKQRQGKTEAQEKAEMELARLEGIRDKYDRYAIGGDARKELEKEIEAQRKIIADEKRGIRGVTAHGQPAVKSAAWYAERVKELEEDRKNNPARFTKEAVARMQTLAEMAEHFHKGGGRFRADEWKIPITPDYLQRFHRNFDKMRIEDYMVQGLDRKSAEQLVAEENRNTRREYLQREIADKRTERAALMAQLKTLPYFATEAAEQEAKEKKPELTTRGDLIPQIKDINTQIRSAEREIKSLVKSQGQMQMSRYGLDPVSLDKIFNATFGGGTFSAYDVMRGGIERDYHLDEMRKQTKHLAVIEENTYNMGID